MSTVKTLVVGLVLAVLLVAPANAVQPQCKAINQTQGGAHNSNNSADPLGDAISEAAPGDTIKILGTCYGDFVIDKDLTLRGRSSAQHEDVIDGSGSGSHAVLLTTAAVSIIDLTIRGGQEVGIINQGDLSLTASQVTRHAGSGVSNGSGSLAIEDSVVSDNDGAGVSGGLFGSVRISNSVVRGNLGRGVSAARASVTISNSVIADNGGGVSGSRRIEISDSLIEGNTTEGAGGGIAAVDLGTLELTDSTVRDNTASRGGGISLDRSLFANAITGSVVTGNSATEAGGGIYGPGEDLLTVTNSTVSNNSAISGGGMFLFAHGGNRTEITKSTLIGNTAVYGGGIWNDQPLTLTDSAVTGNTATTAGGGIFGAGAVTLVGTSTVCGNDPDDWPGCSS